MAVRNASSGSSAAFQVLGIPKAVSEKMAICDVSLEVLHVSKVVFVKVANVT